MSRLPLYIALFFLSVCSLSAQDNLSSKKHVKLAQQLLAEYKFGAAAQHYEAAWSQKPKKLEWLNEAAQSYLKAREYRKAAESFGTIKDNKFFPKARLNYAISLQQSGQFDEAIPEFLLYLNGYDGKDRDDVQERIEDYINGCTAAIRQMDSVESKKIQFEHLSATINSVEDDVAPMPFGDDILYFTNITNGNSKLLRSQQLSNDWSLAQDVQSLPLLGNFSIENGVFSSDGSRFYCTACQMTQVKKEKKRTCAIYVLKRTDKGWSSPAKLPERINTEGGITTQPYVFTKDGKEILLFASNRVGGKGGMDIWNATRDVKGEGYTEPQNMGSNINTEGDEATPYYDSEENALYFSSNGLSSFGGLDIFKSKGLDNKWSAAENIGAPFNSGADDYFFVKNKSLTGGFFVSNRTIGMEKISSRDDDIFSFKINNRIELSVAGKIFEKETKSTLENARISLYERRGGEMLRLLSSMMAVDGNYSFSLLPQKNYVLEIDKDGFRQTAFDFNTKDSLKNISQNFNLERYMVLASTRVEPPVKEADKKPETVAINENKSPKNKPDNAKNPSNTLEKAENTEGGTRKNTEVKTTPTKPKNQNGVSFKVQVLAYEMLDNTNRKRLSRVDDLGDFDTEKATVNGKTFTRVMLASFENYNEAVRILKKVKDRSLTDAFIIRYEDGNRTNRSK